VTCICHFGKVRGLTWTSDCDWDATFPDLSRCIAVICQHQGTWSTGPRRPLPRIGGHYRNFSISLYQSVKIARLQPSLFVVEDGAERALAPTAGNLNFMQSHVPPRPFVQDSVLRHPIISILLFSRPLGGASKPIPSLFKVLDGNRKLN
jgi:hypothetical protein